MASPHQTVLEINLKALEHNYNYLKSKLTSETKFLGVVKAFAYGTDAVRIAKKLTDLGVDYLAVAYVKEGVQLRQAGVNTPILVLHPQPTSFKTLLEHNLEPSLYSMRMLDLFLKEVEHLKNYPIHLKFNTGLNRLGFSVDDIDAVLAKLKTPQLKIASVFSHLAATEDRNEKEFTLKQLHQFKTIVTRLENNLNYPLIKHVLNTSGILNYPEAQYNMVRSGIGLYGYGNDPVFDQHLQPIATLKTVISQLHTIPENESVGYNRKFVAAKKRITATLPIGHADGIGREYGQGKTYVTVHGQKALIIGNVCMDMIMIDVTHITCNEGDEVIIFGAKNTATEFANTANTISYELLTRIGARVERLFSDI